MRVSGFALEHADALIRRALAAAAEHDVRVAVAAVDTGGNLVAFARADGCSLAAVDSSIAKAFTSAATGVVTAELAAAPDAGALWHAISYPRGLTPIAGGRPIFDGGVLLGGLGVGGAASSALDDLVARTAIVERAQTET